MTASKFAALGACVVFPPAVGAAQRTGMIERPLIIPVIAAQLEQRVVIEDVIIIGVGACAHRALRS